MALPAQRLLFTTQHLVHQKPADTVFPCPLRHAHAVVSEPLTRFNSSSGMVHVR